MLHTLNDALQYGRDFLKENDIEPRESRLLLASVLGISTSELIKVLEVSEIDYDRFIKALKRRADGEPYAYISGEQEFMKLKFFVNKSVLIPRSDTEVLVLEALKQCKLQILDMCTGSGCIAISLAKYLKNANVDAADISTRALAVAKKNAIQNGVKVNFIQSNLFQNINKKYELIVSNPPYIKTNELKSLQREVQMEPQIALDGGETGIYFYEEILKNALDFLLPGGIIMLEIGYDQAESITKLLKMYNYKKIKKVKDLGGNDRVLIAERG